MVEKMFQKRLFIVELEQPLIKYRPAGDIRDALHRLAAVQVTSQSHGMLPTQGEEVLQMGGECVHVLPSAHKFPALVQSHNTLVFYYGSKLLIRQVPCVGADRPGVGVAGDHRPPSHLQHVPKARVG